MAVLQPVYSSGLSAALDGPEFSKPVDLVHLARMTMGDRSLEKEVLSLFRSQATLCLARLQNADDQSAFIEAAHAIKGSARGIGAWKVADIAAELQDQGCSVTNSAKVEELAQALAETDTYIGQLLVD